MNDCPRIPEWFMDVRDCAPIIYTMFVAVVILDESEYKFNPKTTDVIFITYIFMSISRIIQNRRKAFLQFFTTNKRF